MRWSLPDLWIRRAGAFVAAIGVLILSAGPSPAVARDVAETGDAPALTVTPDKELQNQVARVNWTGFTPTDELGNHSVYIYQCAESPTSLNDCAVDDPFPSSANGNAVYSGFTGANGTGEAFFEVRDAAAAPALNCSQSNPCSLLAFEAGLPFGPDELPPGSLIAPLAFARSQSDCPPVNDFDVRAEGEASAARLFYAWAADRCVANEPLVLDYTETSSNSARATFLAGEVDLAITSLPATDEEIEAIVPAPEFQYAPISLNAVVFAYFIVDPVTGERITDLTLSPRLVARIITNTELLDFFNDPEFQALNPGHEWPALGLAPPLLRAERNADTRLVTSWFAADPAARRFLAGDDVPAVNPAYLGYEYPVDLFENTSGDTGYQPRQGEHEVVLRTFYGVRPADSGLTRPSSQGLLGVVDRPTAARFLLPMARILNPGGVAVAPDDTALLAAFDDMQPDPAGFWNPGVSSDSQGAYPLTKIDHAMVPTAARSVDAADAIVRVLKFAAGDGQRLVVDGIVPLPGPLRTRTREIADSMKAASGPTTTTTPPPSTTVPYIPPVYDSTCCAGSGLVDVPPVINTDSSSTPTSRVDDVRDTTTTDPLAPSWQPIASTTASSAGWALPVLIVVAAGSAIARSGGGLVAGVRRRRVAGTVKRDARSSAS